METTKKLVIGEFLTKSFTGAKMINVISTKLAGYAVKNYMTSGEAKHLKYIKIDEWCSDGFTYKEVTPDTALATLDQQNQSMSPAEIFFTYFLAIPEEKRGKMKKEVIKIFYKIISEGF